MRFGLFSTYAAIFAAIVSVAAALNLTSHSSARHSGVAFVDFQAIMQQSEAGKSIQAQIAPSQKALQDSAQAKLKELKKEQDELNLKRGTLGEGKFAEQNETLQKKINDWNAEAQKRGTALNAAANPAIQKLDGALRDQLARIASEYKFTAILPLQEAFYSDKELDITSEAMRRLDEQLPNVDVRFEDEKKAE